MLNRSLLVMLQNQSVNRPNGILNYPYNLLNPSESTKVGQNSGLSQNYLQRTARNGLQDNLISIAILS
jgi:hypothetical protein